MAVISTILVVRSCNGPATSMEVRQRVSNTQESAHLEIMFNSSIFILGLGLYLQVVSQRPEVQGKFDFHHLDRPISSLSAYEHLHRIFRLCTVHAKRNIRKLSVSEDVRNLMRSLICLEHNDWEGTIQKIVLLGGKVGAGKSIAINYFTGNRLMLEYSNRLGQE